MTISNWIIAGFIAWIIILSKMVAGRSR